MAKKFQPGCPCCNGEPSQPCSDGQIVCVRAYSLAGVCQYASDHPGSPIDYEDPSVALGGLPVTVYLTDSTNSELSVAGTCTTSDKGKCCVTVPSLLDDPREAATVYGAGGGDSGGTLAVGTYRMSYAYRVDNASPGLTGGAPFSAEFQVGVPEWQSYPALTLPRVNPSGGGTTGGLLDPGWYSVSFQVLDRPGNHTSSANALGPISSYSSAFYVDTGEIPRVTWPKWWDARPNADKIRAYIARVTATPILDDDGNPTFDEFGNPLYSFSYGDYRRFDTLEIGERTADITVYPELGELRPTGNTIAKSIPRAIFPGPMPAGAVDTLLWVRPMPSTSTVACGTTRGSETNLPGTPSHSTAFPTANSTSWSRYKIRVGPPDGLEYDRCDYVDLRNIGAKCRTTIKDFAFCEIQITWTILDFDTEEPVVGARLAGRFFDAGNSGCGETDTGRIIDNGDGTYTFVAASSLAISFGLLNCYQGEPATANLQLEVSHPDYFSDTACGEFAPCGIPRAVYSREIRLFKRAAKGGNWVLRGYSERLDPVTWSVSEETIGGRHYLICPTRQCLEFCGAHCASPELQDQGGPPCYGACQTACGRPPDDRSRRGDIVNKTLHVTFSGAPLLLGSYSGSTIQLDWDETSSDGGSYGQPGDPPNPGTPQKRWLSGCLAASGASGIMYHRFYTIFGQQYIWADLDHPINYGSAQAAYVVDGGGNPGDMEEGLWFENYWGTDCTDPTLETCPDIGDPLGLSPFISSHRCERVGYPTDCRSCGTVTGIPEQTAAFGPKRINAFLSGNYLSCASDGTNFVTQGCSGVNYSCPPSWAMWSEVDYVISVGLPGFGFTYICCDPGWIPELNYCGPITGTLCSDDCQKWGFVLSE